MPGKYGSGGRLRLVGRVGRLPELLGSKRMDDADLEAGGGEGVLDDMVIASGPFDGDDQDREKGQNDLIASIKSF
jgi:hypothetical protein